MMPKAEIVVSVKIKGLWKWRLYLSFLIALSRIFPEYMLPTKTLYRWATNFIGTNLRVCVDKKEHPI